MSCQKPPQSDPSSEMTHSDLAEPCQPHGECRGHEVLEGEVQALLVEAQRAVQRLLHCAPHQVGHVPRRALPQLLVRQLTQIPAGQERTAQNTSGQKQVLCDRLRGFISAQNNNNNNNNNIQ